jgi:hypothetical protein
MVTASKKPKAKAAKPTKDEKDAKRLKDLTEYNERLNEAYADANESYSDMMRAKEQSKQATAHYQSCQSAIQRIIKDYNDPQQSLPLFHGNGSAAPKKKPEPKPAAPAPSGNEPWRGVLLKDIGIDKRSLKALDAADIRTIGQMSDWQKTHNGGVDFVNGIGKGSMEKISDAMEAYWKANPVAEVEVASEPESAGVN